MNAPISALVHGPALDRVAPLLDEAGIALAPILIEPDGTLTRAGAAITPQAAAPRVAWACPDLYMVGLTNRFLGIAREAGSVEWLQSGAAGYDNPALLRLGRQGTRISNSDAPAASIGDYVLWAVLDHFQRGPDRRAAREARTWGPMPFRDLAGSTWLIVGYGAIGRQVAQRARGFGVRTIACRRSGGSDPAVDAIVTPDAMAAALAAADVVVMALPLSERTRGMVDAAFLGATRPGALLVNVGRGGLVDEPALLAALDQGRPGHAVLDVTAIEPLPADSPIWTHPRITLTPHVSGMGSGLDARGDALFVANLRRFVAGEPLLTEIDPREFADA